MRKLIIVLFSITCIAIVCFASCIKKPETTVYQDGQLSLPSTPYSYFGQTSFNENRLATIGRVLFYDKHLSKNNTISCASCHIQEHAFGDNKALSHGFESKETHRNSIAIHNITGVGQLPTVAFMSNLFWDGRSSNIKEMVLQPAVNHIEMGLASNSEILKKVQTLDYYNGLFYKPLANITLEDISDALSHFVVSINVIDSKFDQVHPSNGNSPTAQFSALEQHGESIFHGKYNCSSCHNVSLFGYGQNNGRFANIGLDKYSEDKGRMNITGDTFDEARFKVPGLRNVQFSAPYMHDGRFKTLDEVLEHYSHGIQSTPNLDWELQDQNTLQAKQMNITDYDKKALIAFLNTLTDYDVLTHDRFANPFSNQ